MKITNLSMPAALTMSLLAGCAMQPGDEASELDTDQAAQAGAGGEVLDARVAVAAETKDLSALTSQVMQLTTWYSGAIAAGGTQHWVWNNAPATAVYQAGTSPLGASTASACNIEVTRTWDVQHYGGEREFHFELKNTGSITCGATVLLDSMTRVNSFASGGIDAGVSRSYTWNNANPTSASFYANLVPSGATSGDDCVLEVTRTWYVQQPGGEREFHFTVKNAGAIACQGTVNIGLTSSLASSWQTAALSPGASQSWTWNNANPLDRIYVPGLSPLGASGLQACSLEVTQSYYRQVLNTSGTTEREFHFTVKNVGSLACYGTILLSYMN
jgi:hypothetical protein